MEFYGGSIRVPINDCLRSSCSTFARNWKPTVKYLHLQINIIFHASSPRVKWSVLQACFIQRLNPISDINISIVFRWHVQVNKYTRQSHLSPGSRLEKILYYKYQRIWGITQNTQFRSNSEKIFSILILPGIDLWISASSARGVSR